MIRKLLLAVPLSILALSVAPVYADSHEEKKPDSQLIADSHEEKKPDSQLI